MRCRLFDPFVNESLPERSVKLPSKEDLETLRLRDRYKSISRKQVEKATKVAARSRRILKYVRDPIRVKTPITFDDYA